MLSIHPDVGAVLRGERAWALAEGDALALLPRLPGGLFATLLTDPPYGTHAERDGYGRRQKWGGAQRIANDADLSALDGVLGLAGRLLTADAWVVFFCSPKRRDAVGEVCRGRRLAVLGEVVWDKQAPGLGGGLRYQHETALLCSFGEPAGLCGLPSVWGEWVPKGQHGHRPQFHPHEKPLGLLRRLVCYTTPPGGLVLDPFAGGGSTAVACLQAGRRCLGVELSPECCAVARERVACGGPPSGAPTLFDAPDREAP